jgi:hypothetical protein
MTGRSAFQVADDANGSAIWSLRDRKKGYLMDSPFKTPEQLLAYKTVAQLLAARSSGVASVAPDSSVFVAVQLMESRNTGLLVVAVAVLIAVMIVAVRACAHGRTPIR